LLRWFRVERMYSVTAGGTSIWARP
jgi:hypothetical protein